ncbi:Acetyl esterase [Paenibacillus sp. JJ-100]|uniref:alpha/beta hydrolase n=1 Tax=Paenibacillus sp. JJ-100 TaxID=2974896 RepID=UPI0022FF5704|nr:alpha/beta hydrolase [Paenibacillus sp. JJ-100]CAI6043316.1 Acetyl esterase [Paenibacillus sp. JJ-100]
MDLQQQIAMVQQMRQHSSGNDQSLQPSHTYDVKVKEFMIPTSAGETRVLIYTPGQENAERSTFPIFFNMHGGGFVLGQADGDDAWCRLIAGRAGCIVVNIDYKLAPEHKFPTAVLECYDVVKWVHANAAQISANASLLAIGGHSAGGNLAAAVCLLNRERGDEFPILLQIIDYAVLDLATDPGEKPDFPEAIPADVARTFNAMYLTKTEDAVNPLASPVLANSFSHLPEALIITAERDSLAQEARNYASKLEAGGVKVTHKEYEGAVHGFTHHGDIQMAEDAWYLMSDTLRDVFSRADV